MVLYSLHGLFWISFHSWLKNKDFFIVESNDRRPSSKVSSHALLFVVNVLYHTTTLRWRGARPNNTISGWDLILRAHWWIKNSFCFGVTLYYTITNVMNSGDAEGVVQWYLNGTAIHWTKTCWQTNIFHIHKSLIYHRRSGYGVCFALLRFGFNILVESYQRFQNGIPSSPGMGRKI